MEIKDSTHPLQFSISVSFFCFNQFFNQFRSLSETFIAIFFQPCFKLSIVISGYSISYYYECIVFNISDQGVMQAIFETGSEF